MVCCRFSCPFTKAGLHHGVIVNLRRTYCILNCAPTSHHTLQARLTNGPTALAVRRVDQHFTLFLDRSQLEHCTTQSAFAQLNRGVIFVQSKIL